jgi:hypothetical protein
MDYTLERFHHFTFDPSKFIEGLCLFLKDRGEGLDRIALFKLLGERVVDQFPGLLFISMQGNLEERPKRRVRRVTHIPLAGRRNWLL